MRRLLVVSLLLLLCVVAVAGAQPTDHRGLPLDDYERNPPGPLMYIVGAAIALWVVVNAISILAWLGRSARTRLRDDPKMRSRVYQLVVAGVIVLLAFAR